ncbi:transcriptional attenuator, LytR family [Micromonospora rhizosphaerae]|uniref:Transcriptional attenuator, LytR family n=1 Tax=Micromonospora rhizosphaerae TaxID=568872 RepID=A0A1C6RV20_9ACTN|nr:LCP family protein [Micromonospora rhizosphaerae]SCL20860.1 transcriptional attenuator, LytR family [Micromonospora rhizosphaerae]
MLATLLVLGGGIVAIGAYGRSLNDNLARTDAFAGLPESARPTQAVTGAMNVLLLGSDSRDPDTTANSRTDTIMLLHLDADHKKAEVISIPRDTWVFVPKSTNGRHGDTMAKINSAYAWGGTPLMVQTVETFTGVHIDHVALIDFAGFKQVVNALGGVDLKIEKNITSIHPPYRTFKKGTQHLDGAEALDYVRQRHQFTDGDFSRERHQREFLQALLDRAASIGTLSNPVKLNAFLQAVTKSVTVDKNFDLVDVALELRDLRSEDLTFLGSPSAGSGTRNGQSVVLSDTAKARTLYQAVADDTVQEYVRGSTAPKPSPTHSANSRL